MPSPRHPRLAAATLVLAGSMAGPASAQVQPTMPTAPQPEEKKRDGVAEQAPVTPGQLPTTPTLPPPRERHRRFENIQVDGFFRFRTNWNKNFSLGFDDQGPGGAPFPRPLACRSGAGDPCSDKHRHANMRLHLAPIIFVDERTSVHVQADVLDNLVLGSTPVGFRPGLGSPGYIPLPVFGDGQAPPQAGVNSDRDSIVVKRAWAEVMTAFGLLKFGRMPTHWGTGMLINAGTHNPLHPKYDILAGQATVYLQSDHGDTVDRLSFSTEIPGTDLVAAIATDWGSTRPVANQAGFFDRRIGGQPFDLEDSVDLNQWVFSIAQVDSLADFREKVARGELALNYGAYMAYRKQNFDFNPVPLGMAPDPDAFVPRGYKAFVPDLWARLGRGRLLLEVEVAAHFGEIESLPDFGLPAQPDETALKLRQFGGVARMTYRLLNDDLRLGFEIGSASGDQYNNNPQGATHVSNAQVIPDDLAQDRTSRAFFFNPDYHIDLILFRELIGTVTNATYLRPSLEYELTQSLRLRGQSVVSFANRPVSTPGNARMYGVELNGDLGYSTGNFFAGIAYGVLFPLAALNHPADSPGAGGPGFGYGTNAGDAGTAHTIQMRLMLAF